MKPQISKEDVLEIIKANNINLEKDKCVLVGIRGYYLDSMGVKGKNDRGVYDDALIWVTPNVFATFKANTDPSRVRKGKGTGSAKGMASLNPGVWRYCMGMHNGSVPHPAFRQAASVLITRDGYDGEYQDVLTTSINIHRGGASGGTSSLGCQTIPAEEWDSFKSLGYGELKRNGQTTFPYILITEIGRREGALKVSI